MGWEKYLLLVFTGIILCGGIVFTVYYTEYNGGNSMGTTTYVIAADSLSKNRDLGEEEAKEDESLVTKIIGPGNEEMPSPFDWIDEKDIIVEQDKIIILLEDAQWSRFTDTNSMDPVIDSGANAIQIVPKSEEDVHVGDIISYESKYSDGIIIHRVTEVGHDDKGWFAKMKGDNNSKQDPGKVRFDQVKRIVVAVIY